ncbi:MAG: hypothetical protein MSA26_13370 [Lachnospiraceae bacterium]|nr:hypothetical protein [Lachnospiraceae bacterium]
MTDTITLIPFKYKLFVYFGEGNLMLKEAKNQRADWENELKELIRKL